MWCPDCGLKNRDGAKFCRTCGKKLKDLPGYKPAAPQQKRKKGGSPRPKSSRKKKSRSSAPQQTPPVKHLQTPGSTEPEEDLAFSSLSPSVILGVGDVLDRRYKVTSHIATGGMGAIYKGEDTRLRTTIAIKEMLDFFQSADDRNYAIKRFQEEALLLADLRHPNIPRVTDNFIENSKYYLIMDFIEGKSTEKILQEHQIQAAQIPEERAVKWAVQMSDVLHYLHTRNPPIIYRDMKPSNVMICKDDKVMLVDFGIARHFSPRRPGTMIGTHGYAPPEQYKGNTEPRSDLYAIAATMHHLLSGNDPTIGVPFNFKPIRQWRSDISEEMERILEKALQNLPNSRYDNAGEIKNEFLKLREKLSSGVSIHSPQSQKQVYPAGSQIPKVQVVSQPASYVRPSSGQGYSFRNQRQLEADARKYFEKGKRYANSGQLQKAKGQLEKALMACPNHPQAQCLMGYVLLRTGRSKKAVEHLNNAVMLTPKNARAHLYLGKAYARLGKIAESQKEYRIASRLAPNILRTSGKGILDLLRSLLS